MRATAVVSAKEVLENDSESQAPKPRRSVRSVAAGAGTAIPTEFTTQGNKFVIRLPASLRKKILQISRRHQRSMNSEIILLLGRYLEEQRLQDAVANDQQEALESKLSRKLKALSAEKREALLALLE